MSSPGAVAHRIGSPLAACAILPVEIIWNFGAELTYIWRFPITWTKASYVFMRYIPFLFHIANLVFVFHFKEPFSHSFCRTRFAFLHASEGIIQLLFECILLLRVYALSRNDMKVGAVALLVFLIQVCNLTLSGVFLFDKGEFNAKCALKTTTIGYILPSLYQACQSVIWMLTWYQRCALKNKIDPKITIPVLRTTIRDGTIVLAVTTVGFSICLPYIVAIHVDIEVIYPWAITFLSVACCRLILNTLSSDTARSGSGGGRGQSGTPNGVDLDTVIESIASETGSVYVMDDKSVTEVGGDDSAKSIAIIPGSNSSTLRTLS